jgi:hypothetical protein
MLSVIWFSGKRCLHDAYGLGIMQDAAFMLPTGWVSDKDGLYDTCDSSIGQNAGS